MPIAKHFPETEGWIGNDIRPWSRNVAMKWFEEQPRRTTKRSHPSSETAGQV
jgi:hypothetical protein